MSNSSSFFSFFFSTPETLLLVGVSLFYQVLVILVGNRPQKLILQARKCIRLQQNCSVYWQISSNSFILKCVISFRQNSSIFYLRDNLINLSDKGLIGTPTSWNSCTVLSRQINLLQAKFCTKFLQNCNSI